MAFLPVPASEEGDEGRQPADEEIDQEEHDGGGEPEGRADLRVGPRLAASEQRLHLRPECAPRGRAELLQQRAARLRIAELLAVGSAPGEGAEGCAFREQMERLGAGGGGADQRRIGLGGRELGVGQAAQRCGRAGRR